MQAEKIYKSFVETAKFYLKELDYYGKYQFQKHPLEGQWSIGQLYDHLIHGTHQFHLEQVKNCLEEKNGQIGGKKNFKGKLVFKFNKFIIKVKGLNGPEYKPSQPESPAKIKDDLYKFLKVMNKTAREIDEVKTLNYTTSHPTLGMLNALEWFQLIEIHFRHHLKYKKKIDPLVRSHSKELATEEES